MSVGFHAAEPAPPLPSRASLRLRVLWRMQGPTKIVAAAL
jgi:hypothetical protein